MLRARFGARLRSIRRTKGITQERLAEAVGTSTEFVSNMERGINAPSFDTLEALAAALGVSARDLFDFESGDESEPAGSV